MKNIFTGKVITLGEFANTLPKNVFHRQLESIEIKQEIPKNQHILYRQKFSCDASEKTVIRITADDYYKLYINGTFVTQGPAPGFNFNYYYNEVDISKYVVSGENIIAVHTYYQGLINRVWVSGDDRLGLIYDIISDGEIIACSDETVKCKRHSGFSEIGMFGYETQFAQCYNSNSKEVGFEKTDFDDSDWELAKTKINTDYNFVPQPTPNLCFEDIKPSVVREDADGIFVDFGSTYVGYLSASAVGEKDEELTLLFGQELDDKGNVRYELRANCTYKEAWILSGKEDILNEYDYKSFRYAKILKKSGTKISNLKLISRHYPFNLKRECNIPELKDVWDLCVNSLHYGVQESIHDCMEREKGQYLGDGSFTSCTLAVLTGDTRIMEKLIDDVFRTSFINDGLATCSPCAFVQEIAEYVLMLPHLIAAHYVLTNNKAYLETNFEKWLKVLNYFKSSYQEDDGFLYNMDKWCVVDWPQNARDGYDFDLTEGKIASGTHNVINAYYLGAIDTTNKLAKILGKEEFCDFEALKQGFINAFYDKENKMFRDTADSKHISLPSNAFALLFDLCPDKETEENIIKMILEKDAENSAFFVTFASLAAMVRLGKKEEMIKLMSDKGRWRRMLNEGATVTFEAWGKDVKWNTSLYHLCYSFGALFLTDWGMEKMFNLQ